MRHLFSLVTLLVITSNLYAAPLSFVASPVNAWAYSFQSESSVGDNAAYVPSISDITSAVFQGYAPDSPPSPDTWGGVLAPYSQSFSFHTFETHVVSSTDQVVSVVLDGDDGHTLYVDGLNVGGGGFGVPVNYDLHFTAGVPIDLKIVGYNNGYIWTWIFAPTNANAGLALSQVEGIRMNAVAIPETSSILLIGAVILLGGASRFVRTRKVC